MTKRFVAIMSHTLTAEQAVEGKTFGEVVVLPEEAKSLLIVPDDPALDRAWFVQRAEEIAAVVGGFGPDDMVMAMGQQQLAMAIQAVAGRAGARLVEAVTARESVEEPQADGSVRKVNVFRHKGFRDVYEY